MIGGPPMIGGLAPVQVIKKIGGLAP